MSTQALISVDEYLRMTEKPYREYRDGVLLPKPMPTKLHSILMRALITQLGKVGIGAFPELTVCLSPSKFLVPDVVIAGDFEGPYPTEPVTLCCEILSPDDRLGQMLVKCEEYHAWGVPFCWVVDPEKRTAWEYHRDGEPVHVHQTLSAGDIQLSVPQLFASLD